MTILSRRSLLGATLVAPALILLRPDRAMATEPEIFAKRGVAINGTDPVAYFTDARPVAGSGVHSVSYKGADWRFASAANASAFEADPARFAPVFGGYCAYAASLGYLAPTVPEAWSVHEDRLYLNASLRARELWLRDVPGNIAKGLGNWPGILG